MSGPQPELSEFHLMEIYRRVLLEKKWQGTWLRRFASALVSANRQDGEALRPAAMLYIERYQLK